MSSSSIDRTGELTRAVAQFDAGMPVAAPTETVYGLAAPIDNERAIANVFKIKGRPLFDPLIIHIAELNQLGLVAVDVPPPAVILATHFWPGPLTLILPKHPDVNPLITANLPTVAVRMPNHEIMWGLINRAAIPLAAPSANKFGKTSPTCAEDVRREFGPELMVIDGGSCDVGIESTVAEVTEDGADVVVRILRPGMITAAAIEDVLRGAGLTAKVELAESGSSPGHTPLHYMPDKPFVALDEGEFPLSEVARKKISEDLKLPESFSVLELKLDPNPLLAARTLYGDLRRLSSEPGDLIVAVRPKDHYSDEWIAIWDRLVRASSIKSDERAKWSAN